MRTLRVRFAAVLGMALASAGDAFGGSPHPDRPFVTKAGDLVDGVEVEAGTAWQGDAISTPVRLKFGTRWLEPRVQADLGGLGSRRPGLVAGLKLAAVQEEALGLAGYAESAVPLTAEEAWSSEVGGAVGLQTERGHQLRFNLGMSLVGNNGQVRVAGAPLRALLATPLGDELLPYAEVEAVVGAGVPGWMLGTGLGWQPVEALVVDAGVAWDLDMDAPWLQAGVTFNAGSSR